MAEFAEVVDGTCTRVIIAEQVFIDTLPGTWVDITGEAGVGVDWGWDGTTWTAPPAPPAAPLRTLLTGFEWVDRFTDAEWAWLKTQRSSNTQLDKLMDAIRWTNSVDVAAETMDPFYTWLLNNGLPGGQPRIDELREGV